MQKEKIKLIAFDADDTLWANEQNYRKAEISFGKMMEKYCSPKEANEQLLKVEKRNLPLLGYGSKPFIISLVECGIEISKGALTNDDILELISIGKRTIGQQLEIYPHAENVLKSLSEKYPLSLFTKGDLLEQESKIARSGLSGYFSSVEIMSEKNKLKYSEIIKEHEVKPEEMVMVGNSFKSDILPILEIGGWAVYIPSEIIWAHEVVEEKEHPRLIKADSLNDLLRIF
jgi:putative hydrolase of the HAD superfamily